MVRVYQYFSVFYIIKWMYEIDPDIWLPHSNYTQRTSLSRTIKFISKWPGRLIGVQIFSQLRYLKVIETRSIATNLARSESSDLQKKHRRDKKKWSWRKSKVVKHELHQRNVWWLLSRILVWFQWIRDYYNNGYFMALRMRHYRSIK